MFEELLRTKQITYALRSFSHVCRKQPVMDPMFGKAAPCESVRALLHCSLPGPGQTGTRELVPFGFWPWSGRKPGPLLAPCSREL